MPRSFLLIPAVAILLGGCASDSASGPSDDGQAEGFDISVSPASLEIEQGTTDTITVQIERAAGFEAALTLVPDSVPGGIAIASVEVPVGATSVPVVVSAGAVAAPGNTSFVLRATAPGHPVVSARVAIRVVPVVASVEVTVDAFPLAYDDTTLLHAVVRALDGSEIVDARVTWTTADTSVVHLLDDEGTSVRVHGWGSGLATVFALSDSTWGTEIVSVSTAPVDSIAVIAPEDTLYIGQTMQAGALAWDSHGHSLTRVFSWSSSDTSVITLGELGEVRAVGSGEAHILADADGLGTIGRRKVVVIGGRAASIHVSPEAVRLQNGQRQTFTAVVFDEQGLPLEEQPALVWSIDDETIASMPGGASASSAEVQAVAAGTTTVRASLASDPGISGSAQIVVDDPTSSWEGDIGSITVQPKVFGYDYDTETSVTCVYDVTYTGTATAQTILSDQYVDIDIVGEYSATLVSGTGNCLTYDEAGTFTRSYTAPHNQQQFTSSAGSIAGPNLTHVTMQMTGTVPLSGSFDLELTLTPYDDSGDQGRTALTPVVVGVTMTAQN